MQSEQLYYIARAPFEAARRVSILPNGHASSRLHGHSFTARVRTRMPQQQDGVRGHSLENLDAMVADAVGPLNYRLLNDHVSVPTDENLARLIRSRIPIASVDVVGVHSTVDQGADLDSDDIAHIWRKFRFEAAHMLPNVPEGHKCGRMHGHGFEVVLHARQAIVGQDMAVDFDEIGRIWGPVGKELDHACLNDIFGLENPTSEMLAKWIWERIEPELDALSWVTVFETRTAGCHYDGSTYRIWKEQSFESAVIAAEMIDSDVRHSLYGHSYLLRLHLTSELDEVMGWTIDYGDVKSFFKPIYEQLDHQPLHEISSLDRTDVGSILTWIKAQASNRLPQLDRIDLFETPTRGASLCWGPRAPTIAA